ncbi:MAG: hypothetical protein Q9162_006435 [Coniocarpon cinnabarinum]
MAPYLSEPTTAIDLASPPKAAPPLIAPEPEHCPGPESQTAGKAASCAGCPNQEICASAPKGPDPDIPIITERLGNVKHKILVLSGKGGVGKSTFSALLAGAFAQKSEDGLLNGHEGMDVDLSGGQIGLMDTDICGPSIPAMLGVSNEQIHISATGWSPVYVSDTLCTMSVQFLLPSRDSAVIWRGAKKTGLIKQFLKDVEWGQLEYLIVDTPPGTSDEHLAVNGLLKEAGIDGAVLVTTPQEVALLDVRKEIDFCSKAGIPILGLVENMAGFVCPKCRHQSTIFKPSTGGGEALARETKIPFLGSVPLDPRIGMACDYGESFLEAFPESPAGIAVKNVVDRLEEEVQAKKDGLFKP